MSTLFARRRRPNRRLAPHRPLFEALEPRLLMATFTVTNKNDAGPGSLRDAISQANNAPGADTIEFDPFAQGNIILTSGSIAITDSLTINGPGTTNNEPNVTINAKGQSRIFNINNPAVNPINVTLNTLQLESGNVTGDGGAILNDGENLTVNGCLFLKNNATGSGGAIHSSGGSLTVTDSTFRKNKAVNGGAINALTGNVTITNTTINKNKATANGGALNLGSNAAISSSTLSGNKAGADGGAVYAAYGSSVTLTETIIASNKAGENGGGINAGGEFNVFDSTINGNKASENGGGLNLFRSLNGGATWEVVASTVTGNTSGNSGGGLWNAGTGEVNDSCFFGNRSGYNGAAIYNYDGLLTINDATISGNSAQNIAAVKLINGILILNHVTIFLNKAKAVTAGLALLSGQATVDNSLISQNTLNGNPSDIGGPSSLNSNSNNNFVSAPGFNSGLTNSVNGNILGNPNPLVSPLVTWENGHPSIVPFPNSPLVGAGSGGSEIGATQLPEFDHGFPLNGNQSQSYLDSSGQSVTFAQKKGGFALVLFPDAASLGTPSHVLASSTNGKTKLFITATNNTPIPQTRIFSNYNYFGGPNVDIINGLLQADGTVKRFQFADVNNTDLFLNNVRRFDSNSMFDSFMEANSINTLNIIGNGTSPNFGGTNLFINSLTIGNIRLINTLNSSVPFEIEIEHLLGNFNFATPTGPHMLMCNTPFNEDDFNAFATCP